MDLVCSEGLSPDSSSQKADCRPPDLRQSNQMAVVSGQGAKGLWRWCSGRQRRVCVELTITLE